MTYVVIRDDITYTDICSSSSSSSSSGGGGGGGGGDL